MTGAPAARWTGAEARVKIECPPGLMDEIRAAAVEGCLRLVRGGLEIGGILFGTRQGDVVTVQAFRPTPIRYALGPTFLLSEQDRAVFADVLQSHETDPDLKGMTPAGWFVSHSRSDAVTLTNNDAAICDEYFKEPWQTVLVLRPERSGKARAAFFTRDANGRMKTGKNDSEFELVPVAAPAREIPDPPSEASATVGPPRDANPQPRRRLRALVLALWAISAFLLGAGVSTAYFLVVARVAPAPPLALTVSEEGKALLLAWNPAALANAENATLEVQDSSGSRLLRLTRPQVARGAYPLPAAGDEVRFRMTGYDARGSILGQATTRYIGAVTTPSPQLEEARGQAERLQDENTRLKGELSKEAARAKVFEERSRVLEKILKSEQAVKGAPR